MSSPIDYNKLTIPKLKDELKKRGISITGLKKKNEFIEKLEQDDKEKVVTEKDPPSTTIEKSWRNSRSSSGKNCGSWKKLLKQK